jgi:hypothetical protein
MSTMMPRPFANVSDALPPAMLPAVLANLVWITASEFFRYLAFVRPMIQAAFPSIPDVAPMGVTVIAIWMVWGGLLLAAVTGFAWLYLDRFGGGFVNSLKVGTMLWVAIFCILWLGLYNMNMATARIALTALPLAWIEMVVAVVIVDRCRRGIAIA